MATVCVFGAGSIGCYVGGRLLAAGADLRFVGRPAMARELGEHGLILSDYRGGHWSLQPGYLHVGEAALAAEADLVLVTVKSAATARAASELALVLKPGALVLSLQNGLGNADILRDALPGHTVLAGMVPFNVVQRGGGVFHQGSEGELHAQADPALKPWLALFVKAGLSLDLHHDMLPVQWGKLLLNLNNPINALADLPLKTELSQRAYRQCLALAQGEALGLLQAAKIHPARLTPLPAAWLPRLLDVPDALFRRLASSMLAIDPLARSSMSDDLAAGRATEVDWINGEVVKLAERLGRRAPVNARLCALVREAEQSAERPAWSGVDLLKKLRGAC